MNFAKKLLAGSVAASVLAVSAIVPVANAEVSGSVGVASTYLWRGYDLGSGTPAVSGDINYSNSGFYTGVWGSSGDANAGSEYDLYAGYGMSFGEDDMFSFDVSVWNYNYPTGGGYTADGETDFGDLTDLVVSIGVGPIALTMYDNVAGANGYAYYTLSGGYGPFSATLGMHSSVTQDSDDGFDCASDVPDGDECEPVHLNLDYAYNDNLTFTISQFIADETDDDDMKFVVSYSLPIGE